MLEHLTELYVICDEFVKKFDKHKPIELACAGSKKRRNRLCRLSKAEILCIVIAYQSANFKTFKSFYLFLSRELKSFFPQILSYQRFVELMPRIIPHLNILLQFLFVKCDGLTFIDSTALKVCHNKRARRHKVFKGYATWGCTSLGYFFGFKLHLMVNTKGEIVNAFFSHADVDDRKPMLKMCKKIHGFLVGDKGYLSQKWAEKLQPIGVQLVTKGRKNMKKHRLTLEEINMLNCRSVIETTFGKLKETCNLEHSRHRSITGFIINAFTALVAYIINVKKPNVVCKKALYLTHS